MCVILNWSADATRQALKAMAGQASLPAPLCGRSSPNPEMADLKLISLRRRSVTCSYTQHTRENIRKQTVADLASVGLTFLDMHAKVLDQGRNIEKAWAGLPGGWKVNEHQSRNGDCLHVWLTGRADLIRLFQKTLFRQANLVTGDARGRCMVLLHVAEHAAVRTAVRLSCTGKQRGGKTRQRHREERDRGKLVGRAKSKTYPLGRAKKKKHRE